MDFIDYNTFSTSSTDDHNLTLPEPAPPLVLPLNTSSLTNKLKSLSLLGNQEASNRSDGTTAEFMSINNKTEKYAKLALDLLQTTVDSSMLVADLPAQDSHSQTSKTRNNRVLSNKLAQVLNSYEFNDSSFREALNILETRRDLDLDTLIRSDLYGSIARRSFRSDIESELLQQHAAILKTYEPIVSKIESLTWKINDLSQTSRKLNDVKGMDPEFLKKVEEFGRKKKLISLQKTILLNFKMKFTLTQYEEHYLTSEPISMEYFEILNKAKKIHSSCTILLSLDNQNLGIKIMEKMNSILDLSYQRISFFLTNKLLSFMKSSQFETSENYQTPSLKLIKISFRYLSSNLQSFNEIIDKLVQSRSKIINDEFVFQLNNLDDNFDHYRPIALSAHDPLRYIGDILAYVHSIIVNEVEFITNLFRFKDEGNLMAEKLSDFEKSLQDLEDPVHLQASMDSIISKVLGSLQKPLKLRIAQVLRNETQLDIIYQVFNLLELYKMMYHKSLKEDDGSGLIGILEFLQKLCIERVFNVVTDGFSKISKDMELQDWATEDDSLLAPEWLNIRLIDNMALFQYDDFQEGNILQLSNDEFKKLAKLIVLKPVEMINLQSDKNYKKDLNSKWVFRLNCYDVIESKILSTSRLSAEAKEVAALISETKVKLIKSEYESLLTKSGLKIHQQLIELIFPIAQIETDDEYYMYASLIENKLFNLDNLQAIEDKLHEYLPVAIIDIQQSLFKISSPSIANDVLRKISLEFLRLYNVLNKILKILYEDQQILEWSTFEVATLLGVEELYTEIKV